MPGFEPIDFAGREPSFRALLHISRPGWAPNHYTTSRNIFNIFRTFWWASSGKKTWRIIPLGRQLTFQLFDCFDRSFTTMKESMQCFVPCIAVSSSWDVSGVEQSYSSLWLEKVTRTALASTNERPCLPRRKPLQIKDSFQLQISRAKL